MYKKPDFIKVSVKVKDVFANYGNVSCPPNEGGISSYTIPCGEGDPDYTGNKTWVQLGLGSTCYTTQNP